MRGSLYGARKQFRGWASLTPPWPNPEEQGTPARMGATGEDSPVDARCQRAPTGMRPKKPAKYSSWLGWAQFSGRRAILAGLIGKRHRDRVAVAAWHGGRLWEYPAIDGVKDVFVFTDITGTGGL